MLDKINHEVRERAKAVAEEAVRPVAAKYDRLQEYPWSVKEAMASAGLLRVWIPKEYGGDGLGCLNLCITIEELSRACGGVGVMFAVNALGSYPIILFGTDEQKGKWLPKIASGESLISFALSEKMAGSNASDLKTLARRDGDDYVIRGEKKWTTNASVADYITVFAVTDPSHLGKRSATRGISAILVEKGSPGLVVAKTEDKMGIRCVPVVELRFDNCRVPVANLLGGQEGRGFPIAMQTLDHARPGVAAQAVGLAQGALDYALRFAAGRQQFGKPIAAHQGLSFLLADMATRVDAARHLVYAAAEAIDATDEADAAPSLAARANKLAAEAKLFATDTAMWVTTQAVQVFGGYGYMKDYPIEKYMRDAKITEIYEGTNQIQRLVISRHLAREATQLSNLDAYIPEITQWMPDPEAEQ